MFLKEVPGIPFNTVWFDMVEETDMKNESHEHSNGYCVHAIAGLYANHIYCDLSVKKDQPGFEICEKLRSEGRCIYL